MNYSPKKPNNCCVRVVWSFFVCEKFLLLLCTLYVWCKWWLRSGSAVDYESNGHEFKSRLYKVTKLHITIICIRTPNAHAHLQAPAFTHTITLTYIRAHTRLFTYTHSHTCNDTCTYTHAHMHLHTRTYKHTLPHAHAYTYEPTHGNLDDNRIYKQ